MTMKAPAGAKSQKLRLVVTRANGKIENLGVVSYYHKNPIIHRIVNFWIKLKDWRRQW